MADPTLEGAATLETAADAGKPPRGTVTRWNREIELAGKREKKWRKLAESVLKRFKDEDQAPKGEEGGRKLGNKFNILRPNVRVMKAAVYQDPPSPDVRNRFKNKDPLASAVSEVTERALAFCMDAYDFDGAMEAAVDDMLKPGRAVDRVRYEPKMVPQIDPATKQPRLGPDGKPLEQITWEKVCWDQVQWDDFRVGPAKCWKDVPWVAYRHRLTRDQAVKKLPEAAGILKTIEFDCEIDSGDVPKPNKDDPAEADVFKRLTVWEVWNKGVDGDEREVIFFAPNYRDQPLAVRPDPLGLEEFFDCPRPLYAVYQSDTLEPIEDSRAYADQAKELDNITSRIDKLVNMLKVRGIYDATLKQMGDLLASDEGTLLPSEEVAALYNQGGIEKGIWLLPIDTIAKVLASLYEQREQVKQTIYEITGLSDIMRGSTLASETATAQSIKAQNGAMSIQDRRKAVKRYARDMVRLGAEIICEHFQLETLQAMTGSDYPTEQEKAQIQQQLQMMQQQMAAMAQVAPPMQAATAGPVAPEQAQPGAPAQTPAGPPPEVVAQIEEMTKRLELPSWEQILEVMHSDQLRAYRIDVETDETAFGDQAAEQEAVTKLLSGAIEFMTAAAPLVQMGIMPPELAKKMLLMAVRRFKAGREIEDAIDEIGDGPMPQPVDPNAGKMEVEEKKLTQAQEQHAQKMAFEKERHEAEMARAAKQDEFAERKQADELSRRDAEFAFQRFEAGAGREHAEKLAKMKQQPAANILLGAEGQVADMTEGTVGVADAVRAQTEVLAKLMQMQAAAEQRQSQAIQQMGVTIGEAIVRAATLDRVPVRGKDGKITKVKVAVPSNGAAGSVQ